MFKPEENYFDTCLFEETDDDEETEKPNLDLCPVTCALDFRL